MGVLALVEIDLGDRVETGDPVGVDQQGDVDAVSGHEREPLEQIPAGGDLACERLGDRREFRVEQVQQRSCRELGDPASAVGQRRLADLERAAVEAP